MMSVMYCASWQIRVTEPVWILDRVAVAAHRRQLAEHGGHRSGLDPARLAEALAWPHRLYAAINGSRRYEELAAAYAESVIKLRPFEEGNLRTAFLLAMLFLRLNGVAMPAPLSEKYAAFIAFAGGRLNRVAFAEWMALRRLANDNPGRTVVKVRVSDNHVTQMTILKGPDKAPELVAKARRRKPSGVPPQQ